MTAIQLEVSGFDSFRDLLDTDPYFSLILAVVRAGQRIDFLAYEGFLFKGNELCIPECSMRLCIIQEPMERVIWVEIGLYS